MTSSRDAYQVFGLSSDATMDEIRRRYLFLVRRFHPDSVGAGDAAAVAYATQMTAELNAAYAILSDPTQRASFDAKRRPPDLHVIGPIEVDVEEGERAIILLRVENRGGEPPAGASLSLRCPNDRIELTLLRMDSLQGDSSFPLEVELEVSVDRLQRDAWVDADIEVELVEAR